MNRMLHEKHEFEAGTLGTIIEININCPECKEEINISYKNDDNNVFIDEDYQLNEEIYIYCENCDAEIPLIVEGQQWMDFVVNKLTFELGEPFKEKSRLFYSVKPIMIDTKFYKSKEKPGTWIIAKCPNCNEIVNILQLEGEFYQNWSDYPNKKEFTKKSRKRFKEHRQYANRCLKVVQE